MPRKAVHTAVPATPADRVVPTKTIIKEATPDPISINLITTITSVDIRRELSLAPNFLLRISIQRYFNNYIVYAGLTQQRFEGFVLTLR
jgi:hypothetical protein